jgi:hypothetical protein
MQYGALAMPVRRRFELRKHSKYEASFVVRFTCFGKNVSFRPSISEL